MHQPVISLLLAITSTLVLIVLFLRIYRARRQLAYSQTKKERFVIAVLGSTFMPGIHEQAVKPFIAYIKKYASFEFEVIECIHSMNREKAQEWAHYIAENNISLVLSIGKLSTDTLYNTMKTRQKSIPIISAGIPMGYCEVAPEIMQRTIPFTSISVPLDWIDKITLLKAILPNIKNVLIIFRSIDEISHSNLKEKNFITTALRKMHVSWKMHHVHNIEKTTDLNAELLANVDMILLSRSSEILRYAPRIAQEAAQYNVPIFSTDITSSEAFLSISSSWQRLAAVQAAQYAIEMLEDGRQASDLPLKNITCGKWIIIRPSTVSPMLATTAIGNLLSVNNYIKMTLAGPTAKDTAP